jgi:transglycosylase-like protein with SLT domain
MQWCFLRASLMTLAVFTTFCESKANDVVPTDATNDATATHQDSATSEVSEAAKKDVEKNAEQADDARPASGLASGGLCATVASAAQENGLPISFFSNLIWQESRFVLTARSPVGAQGIAQFMPGTAKMVGLDDPFNPAKALPASARLLRGLYERYGNLGLAAAAYNAGEGYVNRWLRGGGLPRETRNYVLTITGVPVERWKGTTEGPQAFPLAKRMPCRDHEAFAGQTMVADAPAEAVLPKEEVRQRKVLRRTARSLRRVAGHRLRDGKHRRVARVAESRSRRRG